VREGGGVGAPNRFTVFKRGGFVFNPAHDENTWTMYETV
jgi:hypothetical protein